MDHRIILLMLLTTIQPLSTTATSCTKTITIGSCSKAWIIKNTKMNKDVLKVGCAPRFYASKFKLVLEALLDCSGPNADTCPSLEVVVQGKEYKMCKRCCKKYSCSAPDFCKNCKEREVLLFKSTNSTFEIELKDSTCELSETQSTFDETSSSLELYNETKSWIEALHYCDQLSSSLVEITNQTVWKELNAILVNKTELRKGVWVGLERSIFGTNVEWQWTSGAKAEQSTWIGSFPANDFNNHCGKIVWNNQSQSIQLLDANCHDELPFICQDTTDA